MGASPERLARAYRRSYTTDAGGRPGPGRRRRSSASATGATAAGWSRRSSPTSTPMPTTPRRATAPRREATALVDDLARRLAASGTSLTEAVGLFVAARRPFLDELAGLGRRRALDAARLAALYEDASGLLDRLLLRLIADVPGRRALTMNPLGRPARR